MADVGKPQGLTHPLRIHCTAQWMAHGACRHLKAFSSIEAFLAWQRCMAQYPTVVALNAVEYW